MPALEDHLAEVKQVVDKNPTDAARQLFDFSVVDPAMGSAHFLTAALDRIADRIEIFLAEIGGLPGIDQLLKELDEDRQSTAPSPDLHALTSFQRDGLARAKRILDTYNGVLFADGVGMGKTEIGVQLIREHTRDLGQHVLVISPAQLRDRLWEQRLAEANLPGTVVPYQQLAQDRQLSRKGGQQVLPVNKDVYRLVVIDVAHAYRNVDNTWYAALDRLMGSLPKKLLILTATPVNNSLRDLHNLFLLFGRQDAAFAGEPLKIPSLRKCFADAGASNSENLSEAKLFPLIDVLTVRRDRAFIEERYPNERFIDGTPVRFPSLS